MLRADGLLIDREPAKPRPLDRVGRLEQRLAALELEVMALRNGKETSASGLSPFEPLPKLSAFGVESK
jgi:hypothetical protein